MMKHKIIIHTLFSFSWLLILSGCYEKEFLEVLPRGVVVAKTANDFRMLLDDTENNRKLYSLTQTSGSIDVLTDDVSIDLNSMNSWTNKREQFQGLFKFDEFVWTNDQLEDDDNWKRPYYTASVTSVILSEIGKVTDNITLKNQLIAEAKVHRAYAYLVLVNTYAKAYDPATAATDPGVPIITQPALLPSLKRSSVQEVYNFILKDLLEAVDALPEDVDKYKHRPTKTGAYAVLARTYLYMGDYENALLYADKSLQIRSFLYDLNTEYTGSYPYHTKIVKISITTDQEVLLHKTTVGGAASDRFMNLDSASLGKIYPGYIFADSKYENHDLRRTLWFNGWLSNTTKISKPYLTFYGNNPKGRYGLDPNTQAYNTSVATGEMYVTRAEANARLGNLQDALDDLNTLAEKRYVTDTYVPLTLADLGNDQTKVLDETLKERRRELYGKDFRLFDIKRLHLPVTHYLSDLKITVPADDPRLILPIFPGYTQLNPELIQNDRSVSGVVYE